MADFWEQYQQLGYGLAPPRDPSLARLEDQIDDQRLSSGIMEGETPGFADRVAGSSIPFVGSVGRALYGNLVEESKERIARGEGRDEDFSRVANEALSGESAANQSIGQNVVSGLLTSMGMGTEILATGGLASPMAGGRVAAAQAGRAAQAANYARATGSVAPRSMAPNMLTRAGDKLAPMAADVAAGTALSGAWAGPAQEYGADQYAGKLNEETNVQEYELADPGDPLVEALGKGFARAALTRAVEQFIGDGVTTAAGAAVRASGVPVQSAVNAIGSLPWLNKVKIGLGKAWTTLTNNSVAELADTLRRGAGWSNVIGELGEERVEEVLAGALQLEDNYGMTGRAAQMAGEAAGLVDPVKPGGESGGDFLEDLLTELAVLAATGGVMKAASTGAAVVADPAVEDLFQRGLDASGDALSGIPGAAARGAQRAGAAVRDAVFPQAESSIPDVQIDDPEGRDRQGPMPENRPFQGPMPETRPFQGPMRDPQGPPLPPQGPTLPPPEVVDKVAAGRPLSRRDARNMGLEGRSVEDRQALSDQLRQQAKDDVDSFLESDPERAGDLWIAAGDDSLTDDVYQSITGKPVPYEGYSTVLSSVIRGESAQAPSADGGDDHDGPSTAPADSVKSKRKVVDRETYSRMEKEAQAARKAWMEANSDPEKYPIGSPELHDLARKALDARDALSGVEPDDWSTRASEPSGADSALMGDPSDYDKGSLEGQVLQALRAMANKGTRGEYSVLDISDALPHLRGPELGKIVGNLIKAGELEGVKGPGLRVGRSRFSAVKAPMIDAEYVAREQKGRPAPAPSPEATAPSPALMPSSSDPVEDLLSAARRVDYRADKGALVPFRDLRKEFPNLSKEQFDEMAAQASREGVFSLHRHDYPSSLTPAKRDELVKIGDDYYIGGAIRKNAVRNRSAAPPKKPEAPKDIVDGMARVDGGARRGAMVTFRDLRKQYPDMSDAEFASMVTREVASGRLGWQGIVDSERLGETIEIPGFGHAIGASVRQSAEEIGLAYEREGIAFGSSTTLEAERRKDALDPELAFDSYMDRFKKAWGSRQVRHDPPRSDTPSGHVIPYGDVVEPVRKAFESLGASLEIRVGRLAPSVKGKVAGYWNMQSAITRMARAGNLVTILHEAGHGIHTLFLIGRDRRLTAKDMKAIPLKGMTADVENDLRILGQSLYTNGEPANGFVSEGIAELVMLWTLNPDGLQSFPHALRWMEESVLGMDKRFAKEMRKAQEKGTKWYKMSHGEYVESQIQRGSWRDIAKSMKRFFRVHPPGSGFVESYLPVKRMVDAVDRVAGDTRAESKRWKDGLANVYEAAKAFRRAGNSIARTMLYDRMVNPLGQTVGKSLMAHLESAGLSYEDRPKFAIYLAARRALALWDDPNGPRDPGIARESAERTFKALDNIRFSVAAAGWDTWNEQILDYMAALSPRMAAQVALIRATDPGNYAPLEAVLESWEDNFSGSASGMGSVASGEVGKRLKGSGRRRRDPIEAVVSVVSDRISAAHDRYLLEAIVALAENNPTMGEYIERVPVEKLPVAKRPIHEVLTLAMKAGAKTTQSSVNKIDKSVKGWKITNSLGDEVDLDSVLDHMVTFYAPAKNPSGNDADYIQPFVNSNGDVVWYYIKPALAQAITRGSQRPGNSGTGVPLFDAITEGVGMANLVSKMFQVGINQPFLLITQPLRDVKTAAVRTRSNATMPRIMAEFFYDYMMEGVTAISGGRYRRKVSKFYESIGLDVTAPLKRDWMETRRFATGLFRLWNPNKPTFDNLMTVMRNPGAAARTAAAKATSYGIELGQWTDRVARIGEIRRLVRQHGWDLDNLTLDQRILLAVAAKEVVQDNTAGGDYTTIINKWAMYHRSWAQGLRGGVSAVRRRPFQALSRQMFFVALNVGLWLENKDDEEWRNLPPYVKWASYAIKFKGPERDEYLLIPAEQDMETLFVMGVTAALDSWYREEPDSATEFARQFAALNAPVLPAFVTEFLEQTANYDGFTGQPVVPKSLEYATPEAQFDEYTSNLAVWLGESLGWSPKRIDHVIQGIFAGTGRGIVEFGFGTVGRDAPWRAALSGKDQSTRESELSDVPIFGKLFQSGGAIGARPTEVTEVFELARKAESVANSVRLGNRKPETREERRRRLGLRRAGAQLKLLIGAKQKAYKTSERDKITRKMVSIAEQALKDFGE